MIEGSCHCGAVRWRFHGTPDSATACNCTVCRRYGVLWAYGWDGDDVEVSGTTREYVRGERMIGFHFCGVCGCVTSWRSLSPDEDRGYRIAVNLRLAEPESVGAILLRRFDGLDSFSDLPPDGRCVHDLWF
jgi:hypothetical protein